MGKWYTLPLQTFASSIWLSITLSGPDIPTFEIVSIQSEKVATQPSAQNSSYVW